ncbi:hypothetical protein NPIL_252421 [Nephila pilipes]|uniref:Secreted protein n=1 Tax=Nephila pilipes TaxID=299642 RepID=A0A8X6TT11_NEPPI|nr:hypothetical protein NPIL_252421 [Nephila pilipes]
MQKKTIITFILLHQYILLAYTHPSIYIKGLAGAICECDYHRGIGKRRLIFHFLPCPEGHTRDQIDSLPRAQSMSLLLPLCQREERKRENRGKAQTIPCFRNHVLGHEQGWTNRRDRGAEAEKKRQVFAGLRTSCCDRFTV